MDILIYYKLMESQVGSHNLLGINIPVLGTWKNSDYILGILIMLVSSTLTILGGLAFTDSETAKDNQRYPLAKLLLFGSFLGGIFAILYILLRIIKIRCSLYLILAFFILFCLMPAIVILGIYLSKTYTMNALVGLGFLIILFVLSSILRALKETLRHTNFVGSLLAGAFCMIVPLLMLGAPLYILLTTQILTTDFAKKVIIIESVACAFALITPWIYFHYKYFKGDLYNDFLLLLPAISNSEVLLLRFENILRWLPSAGIFAGMSIPSLLCLAQFSAEVSSGAGSSKWLYLILAVLIPVFVYCGIGISRSGLSIQNKFNITTFVCGVVPLGLTVPLYVAYPDYQFFVKFLVILPPFSMVIWAFMSVIASSPGLYNVLLLVICLTIALPVGFIYPMMASGAFPEVPALTLISILGLIPATLLFIYCYTKTRDFLRLASKDKITTLKNTTCFYPVLYIIMLFFVFSEGTLIYFYSLGDGEPYSLGGVLGMILLLPFAFAISSLSLHLQLSTNDVQSNNSAKLKFQIIGTVICIILVPISIILIYSLSFLGDIFTGVMESIAIGISLFLLIHIGLLQVKYKFGQYGLTAMTIGNAFMWILLIFPLCVVLPIALTYSSTVKTKNKYIGITTVYLGIVIMLVVSVSSIVYNIYKKKMDEEKLAVRCSTITQRKMKVFNVKCNYKVVRSIFDQFNHHKYSEDYLQVIQKDFRWDDIGDPDEECVKEIMTTEDFNERFAKRTRRSSELEVTEKPKENKKPSFWLLLRCFADYPNELTAPAKPPVLARADSEHIVAFNPADLEAISAEEFQEFRPPILNHNIHKALQSEYPRSPRKVEVAGKDYSRVKSTARLSDLKIDRTARVEWLKAAFNFVATEPNDISAEPWLNENMMFHFCRYGGISAEMITDKQLRILYTKITQSKGIRTINEQVFVKEFVPALGDIIYGEFDTISREVKIVTELLYPCLMINMQKLMADPERLEDNIKPDVLQRSYTRMLTSKSKEFSQRSSDFSMKNEIKSLTEVRAGRKRSSMSSLGEINKMINHEEIRLEGKLLRNCFTRLGNTCSSLGMRMGNSIEARLNKLYTTSTLQEEIKEKELEELEKNEKNNQIESKLSIKDWPEACELIVSSMSKIIRDDQAKKKVKIVKQVRFNLSNTLAILFKVVEILQLSASGFRKEINWSIFTEPLAVSVAVDAATVENSPYALYIFWTSFGIVVVYGYFAYRSVDKAASSNLGINDKGLKAKFFSAETLKKRTLTIVGGGLYIFIIKALMNFFACDIDADPPIVWKTSIVCYETTHIGLIVASIIGLAIYYPVATFMFPLLQFSDRDLDLKLKTTYLVLLSQSKLLVSGLKVFLPYQLYFEYQLGFTAVILLMIFVYTLKEQPSGEKRYNLWSSFGYFFSFLTNLFGLINIKTGGSELVSYTFLVVLGASLIVVLLVQGKYYGFIHREEKSMTEESAGIKDYSIALDLPSSIGAEFHSSAQKRESILVGYA